MDGTETPAQDARRREPPKDIKELREAIERRFLESIWWDDGFGGSDLWDRVRQRDQEGSWVPLSVPTDRRRGANWPLWRTEQDLDRLRNISRLVVSPANSFGKCLLKNITNSVIGKGFSYKIRPKKNDSPADGQAPGLDELCKATQAVVDDFLSANRWNAVANPRDMQNPNGTREREGFRRTRRDGDCFIRLFFLEEGDKLGKTRVRFVEPEQVRNPPGAKYEHGWTYGIKHATEPFEDVEEIEQYHVYYQDQTMKGPRETPVGEIVPASEMVHIKNMEEDAATKRGLPDFIWDTADALNRAAKLQKNTSISSSIRAATAEIWQHAVATQAQVTGLAAGLAEFQRQDPITGQNENIERIAPGTVRRIAAGQQLVNPPASSGVTEHLAACQGDLRQASAAFCAPEYFTGDASNANFASTKEAGTPFVRAAESDQEHFKAVYAVCIWRAVGWAVACGLLPPEAMTALELQVEAPQVTTVNFLEKAQEDNILITLGVKDRKTAAMERGLDPDLVTANNQEYNDANGPLLPALPMPDEAA